MRWKKKEKPLILARTRNIDARETLTHRKRCTRIEWPRSQSRQNRKVFIWFTNANSAAPHCRPGRRCVQAAAISSMKPYRRMPKCQDADGKPKQKKKQKNLLALSPPAPPPFPALTQRPEHLRSLSPLSAGNTVRTVIIGKANLGRPRAKFGRPKEQPVAFLNIHPGAD